MSSGKRSRGGKKNDRAARRRAARSARRGEASKRGQRPLQLVTVPTGPHNPDEYCPVCEAMGIDLETMSDVDVRELRPEDIEKLERAMDEIEEKNLGVVWRPTRH